MEPLRILLVDDHLLFRKGLARLLDTQAEFEVVGEALDGIEGLQKARLLEPDVVLMDIRMPRCDGLEATRRIKAQLPHIRVVILTVSDEEQDLLNAVRYGADGYLLKDLTPETLFQHLRSLSAGQTPLARGMAGILFRQIAQMGQAPARPASCSELSEREGEVLALVASGYTNPEIADELGIARNTVKNHLRSILSKLSVRNRAQAAAYAIRHGLVKQPGGDMLSAEGNGAGDSQ
jgi:DNA-binding NarL/FixJ family response regulator